MESPSVSARNAAEATPKGCAVASALTGKPTWRGRHSTWTLTFPRDTHTSYFTGMRVVLDSRARFAPGIDIRRGKKIAALNGRATQDWPHSVYLRCLSLGNESVTSQTSAGCIIPGNTVCVYRSAQVELVHAGETYLAIWIRSSFAALPIPKYRVSFDNEPRRKRGTHHWLPLMDGNGGPCEATAMGCVWWFTLIQYCIPLEQRSNDGYLESPGWRYQRRWLPYRKRRSVAFPFEARRTTTNWRSTFN